MTTVRRTIVAAALAVLGAMAVAQPTATTVASGLSHPWGLAFLPDGRMLVTEKAGRLRLVSADGRSVSAAIAGVPEVDDAGQGGLFDVLPAPDFAASRVLYLSYAEPESGRNGLAVARAVLAADDRSLQQLAVIYRQQPKAASNGHFGGRMLWSRDGMLFVALGDRQRSTERGKAQDLSTGHGKMVRLRPDGNPAADNPFAGRAGAQPAIWSYGHRNIQGAVLHPQTGELWTSEHGPQGGDEVNRTLPGRNYGWPLVSDGCEYGSPVGRCTPVGGANAGAGFETPLTTWVPTSIAPSGMAFATGDRYGDWRGDLFVGALAGQALWRLKLDGNRVVEREPLLAQLNQRIRDVRVGPDGWIYLLTDSRDGRILRLQR